MADKAKYSHMNEQSARLMALADTMEEQAQANRQRRRQFYEQNFGNQGAAGAGIGAMYTAGLPNNLIVNGAGILANTTSIANYALNAIPGAIIGGALMSKPVYENVTKPVVKYTIENILKPGFKALGRGIAQTARAAAGATRKAIEIYADSEEYRGTESEVYRRQNEAASKEDAKFGVRINPRDQYRIQVAEAKAEADTAKAEYEALASRDPTTGRFRKRTNESPETIAAKKAYQEKQVEYETLREADTRTSDKLWKNILGRVSDAKRQKGLEATVQEAKASGLKDIDAMKLYAMSQLTPDEYKAIFPKEKKTPKFNVGVSPEGRITFNIKEDASPEERAEFIKMYSEFEQLQHQMDMGEMKERTKAAMDSFNILAHMYRYSQERGDVRMAEEIREILKKMFGVDADAADAKRYSKAA
jgi:hypothetical protein